MGLAVTMMFELEKNPNMIEDLTFVQSLVLPGR